MQLANFIAVQPLQHILRQPGGVIVKNKLAAGDADNPGAVGPDQLHRMQVYHHADTLLANLAQHIHDALSVFRIQRGDRLVGQQDPGVLHQRPADRHPLHLPAGEVLRPLQRVRQHVHPLKQRNGARPVGCGKDFKQRFQG